MYGLVENALWQILFPIASAILHDASGRPPVRSSRELKLLLARFDSLGGTLELICDVLMEREREEKRGGEKAREKDSLHDVFPHHLTSLLT